MAPALLDILQGYLTPDFIQKASAFLDERPANVEKAIEGGVPAVLGGLIDRTASAKGADTLLNVISRVGQSADLEDLARGGGSPADLVRSGQGVLGTVFGGKLSMVVDRIAATTGLRQTSASSLLAMLAPVVLGVVGREVASKGLGVGGLTTLLAAQRDDVAHFLPAGLASVFAGVTESGPTTVDAAGATAAAAAELPYSFGAELPDVSSPAVATASSLATSSGLRPWMVWMLVLAVVALGAWALLRDSDRAEQRVEAVQSVPDGRPTAPAANEPAPNQPGAKVPDTNAPGTKPPGGTDPAAPGTAPGAAADAGAGRAATTPGAPDAPTPSPAREDSARVPSDVPAPAGGVAKVALPDGRSLELDAGSPSLALARFLEGREAAAGPRTFVFEQLQFGSGSTRLTRDSQRVVTELAALLAAYPSATVQLAGHTDDRGSEQWNRKVSEWRAARVKTLLEGGGVAAGRLTAVGYGEDKPIAPNTSAGRRKNRRIELIVTRR